MSQHVRETKLQQDFLMVQAAQTFPAFKWDRCRGEGAADSSYLREEVIHFPLFILIPEDLLWGNGASGGSNSFQVKARQMESFQRILFVPGWWFLTRSVWSCRSAFTLCFRSYPSGTNFLSVQLCVLPFGAPRLRVWIRPLVWETATRSRRGEKTARREGLGTFLLWESLTLTHRTITEKLHLLHLLLPSHWLLLLSTCGAGRV